MKKPNEDRKTESSLVINQRDVSNHPSIQKTSEEIVKEYDSLYDEGIFEDNEHLRHEETKEYNDFKQKKWLPADKVEDILRNRDKVMYKKLKEQLSKSVLIEDVEKMIDDTQVNWIKSSQEYKDKLKQKLKLLKEK